MMNDALPDAAMAHTGPRSIDVKLLGQLTVEFEGRELDTL